MCDSGANFLYVHSRVHTTQGKYGKFYFNFSGNLALCDAIINLRIDERRKSKAKCVLSLIFFNMLIRPALLLLFKNVVFIGNGVQIFVGIIVLRDRKKIYFDSWCKK